MIVGVPRALEEYFEDLEFDIIVMANFEGARELELKALAKVLRALKAEEVLTLRLTEEGIEREEGLIISPWRKKSLEGSLESISYATMPFLVNKRYLLWFQSYHPWGGVPDIMLSFNGTVRLEDHVLSFSEPAWKLTRRGRLWKATGLDWKPDLVIEVKRSYKKSKRYPARRSLVVFERGGELEDPCALPIERLEVLISQAHVH